MVTVVFLGTDAGLSRAVLTAAAWQGQRLVVSFSTRESLERLDRVRLTFVHEAVEMEALCRVLLAHGGHVVADVMTWFRDAPLPPLVTRGDLPH